MKGAFPGQSKKGRHEKQKLEISVENLQKKVPVHRQRIKRLILKVLALEGEQRKGSLSVSLVSDARIKKINSKFLRKKCATDVLAFDYGAGHRKKSFSAEIIISADTALKNSRIYQTSPDYEISLYAVHGTLHILGYNDASRREAAIMRRKETEYVH